MVEGEGQASNTDNIYQPEVANVTQVSKGQQGDGNHSSASCGDKKSVSLHLFSPCPYKCIICK